MKKRKKGILIFFIILILIIAVLLFLIATKKIRLAFLWANGYEVQGVDVSHYQGAIDWSLLQKTGIDFAFIKATEGSNYIDENFEKNWEDASKTNMKIGAYHFFSFDSPAKEQAKNFTKTVKTLSGKLAPVIDIEYYGDKEANPPDVDEVIKNLQEMLDELEKEYQTKPIIYTTYKVYKRYIQGNFDNYPLWIRNVYYLPFDIKNEWTFWQFSDRTVLDGYKGQGQEKYIDRNVFCGTLEELEGYLCP